MDNGEGRFKMLEDLESETLKNAHRKFPNHGGVFTIGEIVTLKGSRFRVKSIKPTELRLKLMPKVGTE
uniref:Transporter-associated domain-containing protein n=1 Tax=Candidatus Desulfatibia profunda TaxID=2841695 RepID=A0A8J6TL14_9BACT|nr:hypothetical protein [Candidatus Desulfatibia profunda]